MLDTVSSLLQPDEVKYQGNINIKSFIKYFLIGIEHN